MVPPVPESCPIAWVKLLMLSVPLERLTAPAGLRAPAAVQITVPPEIANVPEGGMVVVAPRLNCVVVGTLVPPLYVLTPLRTVTPVPARVRELGPLMMPLMTKLSIEFCVRVNGFVRTMPEEMVLTTVAVLFVIEAVPALPCKFNVFVDEPVRL
jgi:hypothetical protein